jgi:hypothetical protein
MYLDIEKGISFSALVRYEGDDDNGAERMSAVKEAAKAMGGVIVDNLLDLDFSTEVIQPDSVKSKPVGLPSPMDDLLSMSYFTEPSFQVDVLPPVVLLEPSKSGGLELKGTFVKKYRTDLINRDGVIHQQFTLVNHSNAPLSDFAIQYNVNT